MDGQYQLLQKGVHVNFVKLLQYYNVELCIGDTFRILYGVRQGIAFCLPFCSPSSR